MYRLHMFTIMSALKKHCSQSPLYTNSLLVLFDFTNDDYCHVDYFKVSDAR